jgi:hypothetical protein
VKCIRAWGFAIDGIGKESRIRKNIPVLELGANRFLFSRFALYDCLFRYLLNDRTVWRQSCPYQGQIANFRETSPP